MTTIILHIATERVVDAAVPYVDSYDREYNLTTDHAASSYGIPVLVDVDTGTAYGPMDKLPGCLMPNAASAVNYAARQREETTREYDRFVLSYLRGSGYEPSFDFDAR